MADIASLLLRVSSSGIDKGKRDLRDLQSAGSSAEREFSRMSTAAESLSKTMRRAFEGFAAYFAVDKLKEFSQSLIDTSVALQKVDFTLQAATGSAQTAQSEMQFLSKVTNQLGTSFLSSAQGYAQLAAAARSANVPIKDQHDLFIALSRASSVLHLSQQQQQSSLTALEQMFSKGNVQAQELRLQLGQAIPGLVGNFTKALGISGQQLESLLQKGELATNQVLPALIQAINAVAPDNALSKSVNATNAELNRMHNAIVQLEGSLAQGGFINAITTGARALADLASAFTTASGAANDTNQPIAFVRKTILQLGQGAAVATYDIKALIAEVKAIATIAKVIGGGGDGKLNSITDFIPFYDTIKNRGKITGALSDLTSTLGDEHKKLEDQMKAIDKLINQGPETSTPPNVSNQSDKIAALRKRMHALLSGGIGGSTSRSARGSGGAADQGFSNYLINLKLANRDISAQVNGWSDTLEKMKAVEQVSSKLGRQLTPKETSQVWSTIAQKQKLEQQKKEQQALGNVQSSLQTPQERSAAAMQKRADIIRSSSLSESSQLTLLQKNWDQYAATVDQDTGKASEFAKRAAQNIQDELGTTVQDALQGNFKGILGSWASMLEKMVAQAEAAQLGDALFGKGYGSSTNKLGGLAGVLGNAIGSMFGGGVSASTQASMNSAGIGMAGLSGIGVGLANGGPAAANSIHPVVERGTPEMYSVNGKSYLLTGAHSGVVTPMRPMNAANDTQGGGSVTVNITNNAGPDTQAKVTGTRQEGMEKIIDLQIERKITNDLARGGKISKAMTQKWNLQQTGTR